MPPGDYASKEKLSVYEKALLICHEKEKELLLFQQSLERSKLQKYISYKREERQLRKELFWLKKDQRNLVLEAWRRERENKSFDDLAKEMKLKNPGNMAATAIMLEKKFSLPRINCTQRNVPRILKRSLSHESEYFTWTFGLPRIENSPVKALNAEGDQQKKLKDKPRKDNKDGNDIFSRKRTATTQKMDDSINDGRRESATLNWNLQMIQNQQLMWPEKKDLQKTRDGYILHGWMPWVHRRIH